MEDLTRLFSPPPPPQCFKKEMDSIYVQFRKVFVQFVVLLTKICPKYNDFQRYS